MKKKNVLITGFKGYIGGRLAKSLSNNGYNVYGSSRKENKLNFNYISGINICNLEWYSFHSLVKSCKKFEFIIHLASMNELYTEKDPEGALNVNGLLCIRLLEAAKQAGVKRFIYFSTAHVYGSPLKGHIDEKTLTRPISNYAITHKVAEDFVLAAHDLKKIEGVVIRLSNSFGPPISAKIDRWSLLTNDLCRQAVTNGILKLRSSGMQLRDFITLEDVSIAVKHVLELDKKKLSDGLFNLGSGKTISVLEMTQLIKKRWNIMSGEKIPISRNNKDSNNIINFNYSCDKIFNTGLKICNNYNQEIDDTLDQCVKYIKKQIYH